MVQIQEGKVNYKIYCLQNFPMIFTLFQIIKVLLYTYLPTYPFIQGIMGA